MSTELAAAFVAAGVAIFVALIAYGGTRDGIALAKENERNAETRFRDQQRDAERRDQQQRADTERILEAQRADARLALYSEPKRQTYVQFSAALSKLLMLAMDYTTRVGDNRELAILQATNDVKEHVELINQERLSVEFYTRAASNSAFEMVQHCNIIIMRCLDIDDNGYDAKKSEDTRLLCQRADSAYQSVLESLRESLGIDPVPATTTETREQA